MNNPNYSFIDISKELGFEFEYEGFTGRGHITQKEWECIQDHATDKRYLEIGSYQGYSTTAAVGAFLIACVDMKIRPLVKELADYYLEGDSTSQHIYEGIVDNQFDFILIDANHTYEHCRQDLTNYYPKLKEGGIIAIHDYGIQGNYLGEWGVAKAVDEFFSEDQYIETVDSLILFRKN